jgi:hypothetical protein
MYTPMIFDDSVCNGCNRDNTFAFSFFRTQAEWEEDNRQFEEIFRKYHIEGFAIKPDAEFLKK